MSLLDLYAEASGQEYDRQLRDPGPAPAPDFSTWSMLSAGVKGVVSASFEQAGSLADFEAARLRQSNEMPLTGVAASPEETARRKASLDYFTQLGPAMRRRADEWAPDPVTSHRADQVVHGLFRFGTKAVESVGALGPVGALPLGIEEGNTTAQRLRMQGVDDATALKMGALTGAFSAATAVVPLGGRTILGTLGLIGAAGPGAYVAQEALSKKVLQDAGYNDLASLHDPTDPLGLTLSTLIPGAIGGFHIRGVAARAADVAAGKAALGTLNAGELRSLKYDDPRLDTYAIDAANRAGVPPGILLGVKNAGEKSGPTAVSPAGAQGVMQFMPGTAKEMGLADRTDPVASIDAAAAYLRKLHDAYGSWDAAVAHYNGGGAQAAIVRGGGKPTAPETAAYLERVQKYANDHASQTGAAVPEVVDAARVQVLDRTLAAALPDHPDAREAVFKAGDIVAEGPVSEGVPHPERVRLEAELADLETQRSDLAPKAATVMAPEDVRNLITEQTRMQPPDLSAANVRATAERIQAEAGGSLKEATASAKQQLADATQAHVQRLQQISDTLAQHGEAVKAADALAQVDRRTAEVQSRLQNTPLTLPRVAEPTANHLPPPEAVGLDGQPPRAREQAPAKPAASAREQAANPAPEGAPKPPGEAAPAAEAKPGQPAAEGKAPAPPSLDEQIATRIAAEHPDLKVVLPGSEHATTVEAAMKQIAEEQADDAGWADLVKVAAECALS